MKECVSCSRKAKNTELNLYRRGTSMDMSLNILWNHDTMPEWFHVCEHCENNAKQRLAKAW